MTVRARARSSPRSPAPAGATWPDASWWRALVVIAAVIAAGMAFSLSLNLAAGVRGPVGWDSTQYVWRTQLAQERGLDELPSRLGSGIPVKPGRPAFPALAAPLAAAQGGSILDMSAALPIALSVSVALAAGALGARALRGRGLDPALVALAVAVSPTLVLTLRYAYLDQLIVMAAFAAAAVAAVAATSRGALAAGILLHGAVGVAHAPFLLLTTPILLGAALLARGRVRDDGRQERLAAPGARLAAVAAAGPLLGIALALALGTGLPSPGLEREVFASKLAEDLPRYVFPVMLPLAALGVWLGLRPGRDAGTGAGAVLASWIGVTLMGVVAYAVLPMPVPANRVMAFALVIPILAGAGIVAARALVGRPRLGAALVGGGLSVLVAVGLWQLSRVEPQTSPQRLRDAAWLAAALDHVPASRPVVVIVDDPSTQPALRTALMADHLLAALPAARYDRTFLFLGSPDDYLAGRPSEEPGLPAYGRTSRRSLARLQRAAGQPTAVILRSYNERHWFAWVTAHPGTVVGPGAVVQGGGLLAAQTTDPVAGPAELGARTVVSVLLLMVAGAGWAAGAFRGMRRLELVSMIPATGVVAVTLGGVAADRLGVRLAGTPAVAVLAGVAALGWTVAAIASRRSG